MARTPQLEALSLGPGPPTIHQHMAPGMGLFEMQHHDRPTTRSLPKPPATPHMQPTWAENLRHRFAPPRARLGLHPWTQPRSAWPTSPNPYSSRGRPPQPAHFPSHPIRSRRRPPNPRPGPQRLVSTRPATPTHPPFTKQLVLCAAPPGRSKAFAPSNSWNLEQPSHRLPTLGSIGAQSTASLPDPVATYRPHTNNPPTHRNDQPPTTSTTWSLPSRPSHPSGVPRTIRHPRPLILGLRPSHPTRRIHTSHSPRDATPSLPWGTWRFSHSNTRRPVAGTTTRNTTAPTWSCATTRCPNSRDRPPHSVCKQHPPSGTRRAAQCGPTGAQWQQHKQQRYHHFQHLQRLELRRNRPRHSSHSPRYYQSPASPHPSSPGNPAPPTTPQHCGAWTYGRPEPHPRTVDRPPPTNSTVEPWRHRPPRHIATEMRLLPNSSTIHPWSGPPSPHISPRMHHRRYQWRKCHPSMEALAPVASHAPPPQAGDALPPQKRLEASNPTIPAGRLAPAPPTGQQHQHHQQRPTTSTRWCVRARWNQTSRASTILSPLGGAFGSPASTHRWAPSAWHRTNPSRTSGSSPPTPVRICPARTRSYRFRAW